jgi:hypothetical protein
MAVAFIALLAALGGTAVALPGKNGVKKDDIASGAVNSADIKNNSVLGKDVKTSTIRGSDVGANSLTGSDVNEATLGTVPSAATAGSADSASTANSAGTAGSVSGVQLRPIRFRATAATGSTEILNFEGLVLNASCSAGAALTLTASSTFDNAQLLSYTVDPDVPNPLNENAAKDTSFDIGDTANLVPDNEDSEAGTLRYAKEGGGGVQVAWQAHDNGTSLCAVHGTATGV